MYDANNAELIEIANIALTKDEREQWKSGKIVLHIKKCGNVRIIECR